MSSTTRSPAIDAHPDLLDGTRAMELVEATARSLRRGRTVDLHYERVSESGNFKSVMTSVGCVLLLLVLVALPVALIGPALGIGWTLYIAYAIPPVLILFILLQSLRFAAREPVEKDTGLGRPSSRIVGGIGPEGPQAPILWRSTARSARRLIRSGKSRPAAAAAVANSLVLLEVAVGVDLDDVDLAGVGQAQVDAAVVADPQGPVGVERDLLEPGAQLVGDVGHDRLGPLVLGAVLRPLGLAVEHARGPLGQAGEVHLDRREGERVAVAQDADVELAPFDVLLGQGRVVELLVDGDAPASSRRWRR